MLLWPKPPAIKPLFALNRGGGREAGWKVKLLLPLKAALQPLQAPWSKKIGRTELSRKKLQWVSGLEDITQERSLQKTAMCDLCVQREEW